MVPATKTFENVNVADDQRTTIRPGHESRHAKLKRLGPRVGDARRDDANAIHVR